MHKHGKGSSPDNDANTFSDMVLTIKIDDSAKRDQWITLVEDGSDLSKCKKCKVNLRVYQEKYSFKQKGKQIKDPQQLYFLSLNQEEFENRGFLEMLHYASTKLRSRSDPQVASANDNEINQHKNEFTHLYMMNGMEVKNFEDIPWDTSLLVCCLTHNFKGVFDSGKLVTYHGSKVVKNQNIKNCLFNKTY